MAYFSNGTEALMYEEQWCFRCQHGRSSADDDECTIWIAHFDYGYDLCNDHDKPGKQILDMLIPVDKDGLPAKCSMFLEAIGKDGKTVALLKDLAGKLVRDDKITEAIKVFNRAWDIERTM